MKQTKPYGGRAVFFLFVLLVLMALVYYNIDSIDKFQEIEQTIEPLEESASFVETAYASYVSVYSDYFGNYPPSSVLAVLLPLCIVVLFIIVYNFVCFLRRLFITKKTIVKNIIVEESLND